MAKVREKKLLSLCIICKNEEKNIGTLLDSVNGDLFDEIIAVDTGSTDSTVKIIKKYTDNIYHFKWINDFSAARNFSFSKASGEYIMWLDSDDYIKPKDYQKLLELKKRLDEAPMWLLKYEYAHDAQGRSICSFYRERIIKRSLNLKWQEPIHEYLPLASSFKKEDIEIHHNKIHDSSSRNIPILEDIVKKKPNNARNVFYLGKEYFDASQFEEAIPLLERYVKMPDGWSENKYNAYLKIASYYKNNKKFDKAIENTFEAIKLEPLKAKAYCHMGDIYMDKKDISLAIQYYKFTTVTERPEEALDIIEPKYHTWLPHLQLCLAYNAIGKVDKAAEHNEIALSYRPEDSRMLNNKAIFKRHLKDNYPSLEKKKEIKTSSYVPPKLKTYNKKVAWYCSNVTHYGPNRIRMLNVNNKLKTLGYSSEVYHFTKEKDYDVIIGSYVSGYELSFIKKWKTQNKVVIYDLCEEILLRNKEIQEIIKMCDMVVCCSNNLAKKCQEINKYSICIPDAVEYVEEEC